MVYTDISCRRPPLDQLRVFSRQTAAYQAEAASCRVSRRGGPYLRPVARRATSSYVWHTHRGPRYTGYSTLLYHTMHQMQMYNSLQSGHHRQAGLPVAEVDV